MFPTRRDVCVGKGKDYDDGHGDGDADHSILQHHHHADDNYHGSKRDDGHDYA